MRSLNGIHHHFIYVPLQRGFPSSWDRLGLAVVASPVIAMPYVCCENIKSTAHNLHLISALSLHFILHLPIWGV